MVSLNGIATGIQTAFMLGSGIVDSNISAVGQSETFGVNCDRSIRWVTGSTISASSSKGSATALRATNGSILNIINSVVTATAIESDSKGIDVSMNIESIVESDIIVKSDFLDATGIKADNINNVEKSSITVEAGVNAQGIVTNNLYSALDCNLIVKSGMDATGINASVAYISSGNVNVNAINGNAIGVELHSGSVSLSGLLSKSLNANAMGINSIGASEIIVNNGCYTAESPKGEAVVFNGNINKFVFMPTGSGIVSEISAIGKNTSDKTSLTAAYGDAINSTTNTVFELFSIGVSVKINGTVKVDGNLIVTGGNRKSFLFDNDMIAFHVDGTADGTTQKSSNFIVSGEISGNGGLYMILQKLDAAYNFDSTDSAVLNRFTLVGSAYDNSKLYDSTGNKIAGTVLNGVLVDLYGTRSDTADGVAFATSMLSGHIKNIDDGQGGTILTYVIDDSTYMRKLVASESIVKLTNDVAEYAKSVDQICSVDNGGEVDERRAAFKRAYANNPYLFNSSLPVAESMLVRQNMQLTHLINMDSVYRTSRMRDYIDNSIKCVQNDVSESAAQKLIDEYGNILTVGIRSINGIGDYGADAYSFGSNFFTFGGLGQVDYVHDKNLFFGAGMGAFQSKSIGHSDSGWGESTSFAVNMFSDWQFYDNVDWYFGVSGVLSGNDGYRYSGSGEMKSSWNSTVIGVFSGIRHIYRPIDDISFYIKPLVGVEWEIYMASEHVEKGDAVDKLKYAGRDFNSLKFIAGFEFVYELPIFGLNANLRTLYLHEFLDGSYGISGNFADSSLSLVKGVGYHGAELDRDMVYIGFGLSKFVMKDTSIYLEYNAQCGSQDLNHGINAGVAIRF